MVVVGAGAVKHEEVVAHAEKLFKNLPIANTLSAPPSAPFVGSDMRFPNESKPRAHVGYGFQGASWSSPYYWTFMIIKTLIGNWDRNFGCAKNMSSRLADVVSSQGLAHSISTISSCYIQTGLFTIYAVAPPENLEKLSYEVFEEFRLLGPNLSEEELTRAKNKVKSSVIMHLDGSMSIAEDIGRQILTIGRRPPPPELFARIDSIQISDVLECLELYFNDVCPSIVAMGPVKNLPPYNTMREWTNWKGKEKM